ncbi:MAG: class I SAM-dependent methyltransferase [Marinosulfonomonas sp.]|nr:class I SAM-dependent methyltransferase [Marinosulfonomonas sp.]
MTTEEFRRKMKDSMPITQLGIKHTQHCRVLPNRRELIRHFPKRAVVAEIGVAFGKFSRTILDHAQPRELHLVDAWAGERYGDGHACVTKDFAEDIAVGRVEIHKGLSIEILPTFAPDTFDWVYIDTNHSFPTTLSELEHSSRIVRPEGRISGHDFCTGNPVAAKPYGVVEAVTAFCKAEDWGFEFLTLESSGHFSFSIRRLSCFTTG